MSNQTVFLDALARIDAQLRQRLAGQELPGRVRPEALRLAVRAYPERGGKRLRPALALWSCGLVGGDPEQAWQAALAVELYHNWTLVHDDVIDRDPCRRGEPSCHVLLERSLGGRLADPAAAARYGTDMAILAGDIQHAWAVYALAAAAGDGVPLPVVHALVARLTGWVSPLLISGEALDVDFVHRPDVSAAEAEDMLTLKTGVLLQFAAEAGAMIGLATPDVEAPLVRAAGQFARSAGVAFQLKDDLLGLYGDEARLGKPIGSDLREGKRTVLLLAALERAGEADRRFLLGVLGQAVSAADLDRARHVVRACGAVAAVEARATALLDEARRCLAGFAPGPYRDRLHEWLEYVLARTR